jgi:CRP/FNR family cyclic AMP-dependent transcriptional regulator
MNPLFELIEKNEAFKKTVQVKKIHYPVNHIIVKEKEIHNELFLIIKGGVRIISKGGLSENKTIKPGLADMGAGDIFGEFCLFDDEPASASVVAVEETDLYEIDSSSLKKFIHANHELGLSITWYITSELVKRIRRSNKAVVDLLVWGLKAHDIDKHL